jgi:hypothetical protein
MNVEICGRAILFLEYLFQIFEIGTLQCDALVNTKKNYQKAVQNLHLFNGLLVQHTDQHIVHNPIVSKHGALAIKDMEFF